MKLFSIIRRLLSRSVRVYNRALRVTRDGWFFLGFIFAVGIAAINTGNNLLYLVLGVMLGTVVASGFVSEESVRRLWIERTLPNEIWAGEEFRIFYALKNPRRRLTAYGIRIGESAIEPVREAFFLQVQSNRRAISEGNYIAEKRGMLKLKEVKLSTKFPFGFFEKIRLINLDAEVVVFPDRAKVDGTVTAGTETGASDAMGAHGEGIDLHALRPYTDGDSVRSIHWKASAHAQTLVTKITRPENFPTITVALETNGYRRGDDDEALETAISEAAGYADMFIEEGYMVRLATAMGEVPFGTGMPHRRKLMTHLALFEPPAGPTGVPRQERHGNKIIVRLKK